jgi:cytochrome b involved in lipid metabolism
VRSNVYDLTSWIDQHPGGAEAILSMCGRDATTDFENQHGGQRRPENELQGFEIGTYKK